MDIAPIDEYYFVSDYYGIKLTENLRKIFDEWDRLGGGYIEIYGIKDLQNKIDDYYLGSAKYYPMRRSIEIYTSNKYPESTIIHEILHSILRIEGYPILGIQTDDFVLTGKQLFLKNTVKEISNNLDHSWSRLIED